MDQIWFRPGLVEVYEAKGNYDEAIHEFRNAIIRNPSYPFHAKACLGFMNKGNQDYDAAIQSVEQVLKDSGYWRIVSTTPSPMPVSPLSPPFPGPSISEIATPLQNWAIIGLYETYVVTRDYCEGMISTRQSEYGRRGSQTRSRLILLVHTSIKGIMTSP
jgi:tetratricopeptide (TPR) repeat protein